MKLITVDQLDQMEPHSIFAKGTFIDSPEGVNMSNTGKEVRWVAVRGGIHDWAIYSQNPYYIDDFSPEVMAVGYSGVWDWEKIKEEGDKVHQEDNIRKLVPCDDGALALYRH
jgi:hypothetical protein